MKLEEMDGRLLWLLRRAGDEWGAAGVLHAAEALVEESKPSRLYVNSDRTEPVPGDVVRSADDSGPRLWVYYPINVGAGHLSHPWTQPSDPIGQHTERDALPDRLRLLVDGETGQVVP